MTPLPGTATGVWVGVPLKVLAEAVEKVSYPGLDLTRENIGTP